MGNKFDKFDADIKVPNEKRDDKFDKIRPGSITSIIGRGDDARNSFVYLTIKWSFISGCIVTVLVVVNSWLFRKNEMVPDFGHDIELVWDIVVPIITLALGYAFGKSRD